VLAVVDAEDASLTPLIECIHLSSHCLRQYPRLGSIKKDWQDIHGVEANLGRYRDAGEPDVAIQRGHAIPRNCYPSYQLCFAPSISVNQASKIAERVHHVYHIAVHLDLLGGQGVHCCLDFGLTPIDLKTKRTRLLLHNMQREDKYFEHLGEQCNIIRNILWLEIKSLEWSS